MIYLDYWCLLNFAPEASTFLPTLFSSSFFLSFSPLQPKRTQKSGLFSKREGRGEAWSEENFPSTDGLSWRRGTVGGKNKDVLSDYIPWKCAYSRYWSHEVAYQLQNKITDAWKLGLELRIDRETSSMIWWKNLGFEVKGHGSSIHNLGKILC